MKLRASEQDVGEDDVVEDQHDDNPDGVENEDDAAEEGADDPDNAEGDADDAQPGQSARPTRTAIEERAEAERLARERGQLEGERAARQREDQERGRREQERQEQEALAAMSDSERATYLLAKETRQVKQDNNATRLLVQSSTDQNKFHRTLQRKPEYAKFEDEVERRHQATLSQGGFISREVLLAHLIGEKALSAERAENVRGQRERGKQRIEQQRRSARGARGDRSSSGATGSKSVVQRAEEQDWAI